MTDVGLRNSNQEPLRGEDETAKVFLSIGQKIFYGLILVAAIVCAIIEPAQLLRIVAAAFIAFYVVFVGFKLLVSFAGAGYKFPHLNAPDVNDPNLPTYTILVPMRGETATVFDLLVNSIGRLQYPTSLLQVLFIVDEDDIETLGVVRRHNLPAYMQLVEVPDVGPRTKPKACNWAMRYVTGDRLVILDTEDRPEPTMLLKAVATLNYYRSLDEAVACVQGMLQFWNPRGGIANVFYWAEYVVNFRWMMTGLGRLGLILPLGGTSNHFLTSALWDVAGEYGWLKFRQGGTMYEFPNVWDPYNVTEDAALAAQLRRCGHKIAMVDAVTFEEAPATLKKAKNQKSRWLKGFIQTYLVQSRRPLRSMRELGVVRYLAFNLYIGGTPLSFLINPIMWATTVLYIVSRLAGWESVTLFIESLFPPVIYYPAMFIAVVGNFVLGYQMVLTTLHQQEHESFTHLTVKAQNQQYGNAWKLLIGVWLWWIFTTVPAYKGALELLSKSKRFYWNKTLHGADAHREAEILGSTDEQMALPSGGRHRPDRVGDATTQTQDRTR